MINTKAAGIPLDNWTKHNYLAQVLSYILKPYDPQLSSRRISAAMQMHGDREYFGVAEALQTIHALGFRAKKLTIARSELLEKIGIQQESVILCLGETLCVLALSFDGQKLQLLTPDYQFVDSQLCSGLPRWRGEIIALEMDSPNGAQQTDALNLVTIVLPVRNEDPKLLHKALASLANQTCKEFELVVVDQSDPERFSHGVYEEFRAMVPAVYDAATVSLSGAINAALGIVRTPFTAFLLSDDELTPTAIETVTAWIAKAPDVDVFTTGREFIDENGAILGQVPANQRPVSPEAFYTLGSIVKHLICFRTELARKVGGCDSFLSRFGPDDFDLPWMMAEYDARFLGIPSICYRYRIHDLRMRLTTDQLQDQTVDHLALLYRKHGVPASDSAHGIARGLQNWIGVSEVEVIQSTIKQRRNRL